MLFRSQPSEIRFLAGHRNGRSIASSLGEGIVRPNRAHGRPGPKIREMATDWALVVLRKPISVRPIALRALPAADSTPTSTPVVRVARAGYSEDRPGTLSLDPACQILRRDPGDRFLLTDCDTVKGDSGSPLLHGDGDAMSVVGVTSGTIKLKDGRKASVEIGRAHV